MHTSDGGSVPCVGYDSYLAVHAADQYRTQGNAVVAYLGGDDDMQACKLQGLWGKVLRLAGAHAAAFAAGRILVLAAPDP